MTRLRFAALGVLVLLASISACALPTDESAREIDDPDVLEVMNPTSTTSTTTPEGSTRLRQLFFIDAEDLLAVEDRQVPSDASIRDILNLLATPPTDPTLRSVIPDGYEILSTDLDEATGTLRIDLAQDFGIEGNELPRAVAQIVVTATQLEGWEIEQVRFFLDDQVKPVPAGDVLDDVSEPVDACDYANFFPDGVDCTDIG